MSLVVAAIDFGTTFSGWAFSFKHEFERNPLQVSAKQWSGGQLVSLKGPTCALIKPDGKTLEAFGYEAESKYAEYALDKCHKQYYYFRRFKMMLHGKSDINRDVMIEDENGNRLLALTVFALSIKYLKDDLQAMSENRITGGGLTNDDIHWVLTVPAIWNDAAKQFMREAAEKAGIPGHKLTIALEPEAASLYCRHLPVDKSGADKVSMAKFSTGTKYLVLDAGGGTVDITVHEVMKNGKLKELEKASGGAWGGTKVDDAFETFMAEIAGKPSVMKKFKKDHVEDFLDMFRDFELKKREVRPDKAGKITFRIPISFSELIRTTGITLEEILKKKKFCGKVSIVGDKIRVDVDLLKDLFDESVRSVVDHVSSLLRKPTLRGCNAIMMVGGFSESLMLQMNVKKSFPEQKLIVPDEAGLVVLKGAVIFGHMPTAVAERVCKFTYGVNICHTKSPSCKHAPTRVKRDENGDWNCYNIFMIKARIGQSIALGEEQEEHTTGPINNNQTGMDIGVYATSSPNPQLVTEEGCSKIGHLHVQIPDTSMGTKRRFGVSFIFGGTEIEVKVLDKISGKITRKFVDFLG